jgi:hypothetical protein
MPASVGKTNSISGLKSALDQPEFAAPIGLIKFGSFQQRKRAAKSSLTEGLKTTIGNIFRRGLNRSTTITHDNMSPSENADSSVVPHFKPLSIRVFGVGNAGGQVLEQLLSMGVPATSVVAINTDPQALSRSVVPEKCTWKLNCFAGWVPAGIRTGACFG